jgi:arylformamidase
MTRILIAAILVAFALPASAEMTVKKDIAYAEPRSERRLLDVYAPASAKDATVIVWIHGGGWKRGDKGVGNKAKAWTDAGHVLVSATYRFFPEVTIKEMTADVAKAIKWTRDHAKEFGGNPDRIVVMGHSAGAHLAALVCTDDRYLKAEGVPMTALAGCVPVDVSVYDIPKRLKESGSVPASTFTDIFGKDEATQRDLSPAAHVAKDKGIPPFLILHVADRADTKAQSEALAAKLKESGIKATVFATEGKTHGTINSDLAKSDDPAGKAVMAFLAAAEK